MAEFKQDMPPPGGYESINYKRVPLKSKLRGLLLFGGYIGMTAAASILYLKNAQVVFRRELEVKGASVALYPMLLAERDRAFLKQLRINREEERELMKNIPGWKVGTWYGEPIYQLEDSDKFVAPRIQEFYVHSNYAEMSKRVNITMWS